MKSVLTFTFLLVVFLCSPVCAIQINEVELNPGSGNEWVEVYNNGGQDINISNWELYEGLSTPKSIYIFPENTIINSGDYYVAELNNARTLNNGGDFVTLYDDNLTKIDETDLFKDSDTNDKTWQLCNSEWIFLGSTMNQSNNCSNPDPPTNTTNITTPTNTSFSSLSGEDELVVLEESETQPISDIGIKETEIKEIQTIKLNEGSSEEISEPKTLNNKNYSAYYLISFCFLLTLLYLLNQRKSKKQPKNEFK